MRKKDSAPKKEKKIKQKKRLFRKKSSTDQLIRIEELEELINEKVSIIVDTKAANN